MTSGTAVQVLAAGTRKAIVFQNVNATGNVAVSFTSTGPTVGAGTAFIMSPGSVFSVPPGFALSGFVYGVGNAANLILACTYFN